MRMCFGSISLIIASVLAAPSVMAQESSKTTTTEKYCISALSSVQKVPEVDAVVRQTVMQSDRAGYKWRVTVGDETIYNTAAFVPLPTVPKAPAIPELYSKQCSYWSYFIDGCYTQYRVTPLFSASAEALFINGYPRTLLGLGGPVSYVLVGDKKTSLPSNFGHTTKYAGEAPKFGAAVMRGPNDELFLYDGTTLKELPLDSKPRRDGFPSWLSVLDKGTGRVFIRNNAFADSKTFLFEIVDGPQLKKIELDSSLQGWPTIFSLPGDQQEWVITRYGIYAEKDDGFRPVAQTKKPEYIKGPAGIGFTKERQLYFEVHSDADKSAQPFALSRKDSNQTCGRELDLEKSVEIGSR